jgi:hypothetical protein
LPNRLQSSVLDPFPIAAPTFDPATLDWLPYLNYLQRNIQPNRLAQSILDPFPLTAQFDPATLDWLPYLNLLQRQLQPNRPARSIVDPFPLVPFDWLPYFIQPQRKLLDRRLLPLVIDPTALIPVVFDPQHFPHNSFRVALQRGPRQPTRPSLVITDPTTPAPPVVATGMHEKRKWRRSG